MLPAGYRRPSETVCGGISSPEQNGAGTFQRLGVAPNGRVYRSPSQGGTVWVSLDGTSFRAEQ